MAGNRLRIIRLVPQSAAFYGSDNYGDNTYGQRATDTADLQRYKVVPLFVSATERPLIFTRVGDTTPFRCRIMAFQSEYESDERSGTILDLSGVDMAEAHLHQVSVSGDEHPDTIGIPMDVDAVNDILSASFGDRSIVRTNRVYRATIMLMFVSGRQLTLPPDDSLQVVVVDSIG